MRPRALQVARPPHITSSADAPPMQRTPCANTVYLVVDSRRCNALRSAAGTASTADLPQVDPTHGAIVCGTESRPPLWLNLHGDPCNLHSRSTCVRVVFVREPASNIYTTNVLRRGSPSDINAICHAFLNSHL